MRVGVGGLNLCRLDQLGGASKLSQGGVVEKPAKRGFGIIVQIFCDIFFYL